MEAADIPGFARRLRSIVNTTALKGDGIAIAS
jgi:hypothetical protein